MTTEQKAKAYDEALERAKRYQGMTVLPAESMIETIFPELAENEDERIRKAIIEFFELQDDNTTYSFISKKDILAWLEKQGESYTKRDVDDAFVEGMALAKDELEKQGKSKEYTFKSIPRLLDMIEPSDKATAYCQKLIGALVREGYNIDAKIVGECLKKMNGEDVPMAVMDEKQGGIDNCPLECSTNTVTTDTKKNQVEPNPYSGTSFEYNGHIWGMCARDGGAEVSMDGNLKAFISSDASFIYPDIPQPNLAPKSALEEFKEEKVDNANKIEQKLANSAKTCKKSQRMVAAEAKEALYDKPAWSEKDEEMLDGIILRCEKYGHQEQINWLKSIKQRIGG